MTAEEIVERCKTLIERGTKPTRPDVAPLIDAYYKLLGNGAGGELHCVLDDGNYERCFIRSTAERAERPESLWLARVLLLCSNSQRRRL